VTRLKLAAFIAVPLLALILWARLGPLPPELLDRRPHLSTTIVDRNGVVLFDGLSESGTRMLEIDAAAIPPRVAAATIAAEDKRFLSHPGIDPLAVVRAALRNLRERRAAEGGSTITQQTAKLLLANRKRNFSGKVREALVALRLERRLSKPEILALYLNRAPYGSQYSGIERASRGYFGVPASELTAAQAALLAALPQRPSELNPRAHLSRALARQKVVLRRMRENGSISEADFALASRERIGLRPAGNELLAPHFVDYVRSQQRGPVPLRIETTLDAELQRTVRGIIGAQRANLDKHDASNVAVVVLDNRTGEWLAWEGSGDYFDAEAGGAIDGVISPRQPGSTLKPFTYAVAFDQGESPASVLPDIEMQFPTAQEGVVYAPRNYDDRFRGPLLARNALAGSVNVPAVWLLSKRGTPSLLRMLRSAGITTLDRSSDYYGLGLTLGAAEVRLSELTAAYASFARGGVWAPASAVRAVVGIGGERRVAGRATQRRIMTPRSAYWISDILSDDEARSFVFGRGGSLEFPYRVAVKTGTSQSYRDNWTIGYTREVTVGVWVGNFDRKELRNSTGVTGAAPIFHSVMLAAQQHVTGKAPEFDETPLFEAPADVRHESICLLSGMRATPACDRVGYETVAAESLTKPCSWHHLVFQAGGTRTFSRVEWPPLFAGWGRANSSAAAVEESNRRTAHPSRLAGLQIIHPSDGAEYLIDPTLRGDFQTLRLRASGAPDTRLQWRVNGRPLATAAAGEIVRWRLAPGRHRFEVRDDRGRSDATTISVR
jgi:penicillin-binding protein 1C